MQNQVLSSNKSANLYRYIGILSAFTVSFFLASPSFGQHRYPTIEQILNLPEDQIDLGLSALIIEKQYHPNIDIDASLNEIDRIVATVKQMPEYGDSSLEKMGAILRYFYTPSKWNQFKVYQYDLEDLKAEKNPVSTVSYFLKARYGNCLSMPTLLTVVAQRLEVNVSLAIAPTHVYARYTDEQGTTNIEATSGTLLPDESYIRNFDIHEDALKNKIYLESLSKKEAIAVLLVELARNQMHKGNYLNAYDTADLALKYHPKLARAMLVKGNVFYHQLQHELKLLKRSGQPVDAKQRLRLDPISESNLAWFEQAEKLGWRPPAPDFDERYKQSIEKFKNRRR